LTIGGLGGSLGEDLQEPRRAASCDRGAADTGTKTTLLDLRELAGGG
jgi:hypothetical protein